MAEGLAQKQSNGSGSPAPTPAFERITRAECSPLHWHGVLRNAGQVPVPKATIYLKSRNGVIGEAITGADGRFEVKDVPSGSYGLSVEVNHRTVLSSESVSIAATTPSVVLTLSEEGVLSVALLAEQRSRAGSEELSSQTVSELPLNKRDFSQLLLLAAGTMTDANGATNFTQQFAINGQRGVEAVFAMDRADISDAEMGGSTFSNFNVDAVEEIRSTSGWMPAEIGRGAAGFTNIITRSGAAAFTDQSSSLCGTRPSMLATTSTTHPPRIRRGFHRSDAMSLGSPTVVRYGYRACMTEVLRPSTSASTRAFGKFLGRPRSSPYRLRRNAQVSTQWPTPATPWSSPLIPASRSFSRGIPCRI